MRHFVIFAQFCWISLMEAKLLLKRVDSAMNEYIWMVYTTEPVKTFNCFVIFLNFEENLRKKWCSNRELGINHGKHVNCTMIMSSIMMTLSRNMFTVLPWTHDHGQIPIKIMVWLRNSSQIFPTRVLMLHCYQKRSLEPKMWIYSSKK